MKRQRAFGSKKARDVLVSKQIDEYLGDKRLFRLRHTLLAQHRRAVWGGQQAKKSAAARKTGTGKGKANSAKDLDFFAWNSS